MSKIPYLLVYIIPTTVACLILNWYNSPIAFVIALILYYPISTLGVCAIHELSHFFLFKLGKTKVKEMRIGIIKFDFSPENKGIEICSNGFFSGCCIAKRPKKENNPIFIAAILSGGISGIIIAAICMYIIFYYKLASPFLICLCVTAFFNGYLALFSSRSIDNQTLKKELGEKND